MSVKVSELREILKDFKDDDTITACRCAEELLIMRGGDTIHKIPLNPYAGRC